ncbi:hypothetical protein OG762_18080 [Streptomyces sp. NBC_01136]|uniref:hypothetical protein n=1 Tax=unclassified Streptomyces TaxID=2593676 RepID=UPI003243FE46|nr:hypothetical protein OG762_18080 [Streptomyces sp. NBC_01136]
MTPGAERVLLISSVAANVLSATSVAAGAAEKLPDFLLLPAVLVFGGTALYLLQRFVPVGSAAPARRVMLATTLVLTLLVAYWASNSAWPDRFPLGKQSEEAANSEARKPTAGPTFVSLARGLEVREPRKLARIGTCTAVAGTGQIPKGYQIWAANLNDQGGAPDTQGLFNLRRATQGEGERDWRTDAFGVGSTEAAGKNFWIYVYLLPDFAGSIVENLIKPEKDKGWHPSLSAPIAGVAPFDKIPVQRTADKTCGGS